MKPRDQQVMIKPSNQGIFQRGDQVANRRVRLSKANINKAVSTEPALVSIT